MLLTKIELINMLHKNNIPEYCYSIDNEKNESLCLLQENGKWIIFYSERGERSDPEYYDSEEVACTNFFKEVIDMLNHL
ncbi:MAG TPA: hypothetical protein VJY31_02785 [Buttiauxella sp.]|nr:hypothetical protein [Buttiauxella sp.]